MILIAKPEKPFLYTAKGSPRRQVIIDLYEQGINELYDANPKVKSPTPENLSVDLSTLDGCIDFTRVTFRKALQASGLELGDDEDILQHGCDRRVSHPTETPLWPIIVCPVCRQSGFGTKWFRP